MSALEKHLESLADRYDFTTGFFKPSITEMLDESPLHNFGILLSAAVRQRMHVYDWSKGRFDPITYFLYFFLSQAFSVQNSKKMKADLNIDKIFWRFEGNTKLKMFIVSTPIENSKGRVMMKSFTFNRNKNTEKIHDWSDDDFTDILAKLGRNAKSYQFESHHYDIKFKRSSEIAENILAEGQTSNIGFHIQASYDLSIKVKPGLLRTGQRKSSSRLSEISNPEAEDGTIKYIDDFLQDMLLHPEKRENVKQSTKDFPNRLIKMFKQNFKSEKSTLPEAHCAFMHGAMFLWQDKLNFHMQVAQYSTDRPAAQFNLFIEKKLSTDWKHIVYDYPFIFHIVDSSMSMDKRAIEKRAIEVMVEHAKYKHISAPNSFAEAMLMNYVNFNAKTATVLQNELKISVPPYYVFSKSLGDAAVALRSNDWSSETRAVALNEASDYLDIQLKYEILAKKLVKSGLCGKNSRCLSRYMLGLLSSVTEKVYIARNVHNEIPETTSFILATSVQDTHVMLNFHEVNSFTPDSIDAIQKSIDRIPYVNKESKYLLCMHVLVAYDPAQTKSNFPKLEIHKFFTNTKPNTDYTIEPIKQLSLKHEAAILTPFVQDTDSVSELNDFLRSKAKFLRNLDDFASFAHGSLHDMQSMTDVANPGPSTVQLAYIVSDDGINRRLVLGNFMFGKPSAVDEDLTRLADLYRNSLKRNTADMVDIVSFALLENEETKAIDAQIYTEEHLLTIGLCDEFKVTRLKRSVCKRLEEKSQEQHAMKSTLDDKMKYFKRLGKISNGVMTGLMVKNFIADLIQGNFIGVAVNSGFIIANLLANAGSVRLIEQGAKLTQEGRLLLGGALKAGAPFLARSPSFLFVGYDLYRNLHNNDTSVENKVAVGTDAAYLSLDLAETAIELAELAGLVEGVSAITGPVGWTLGAALLLGADVYKAVEHVKKIEAFIPLTNAEKILEGIRGFIGLGPSGIIENLMSDKQANTKMIDKVLNQMSKENTLKRYILPIARHQKCQFDIYMDLNLPKVEFHTTRAVPVLPSDYSYFCSTSDYDHCQKRNFLESLIAYFTPKILSRECSGAVGIENRWVNESDHSYYHLSEGNDRVVALVNTSNILEIGNGRKVVVGGNMDDVFLLSGNRTTGLMVGGEGRNLLDISNVQINKSLSINGRIIYSAENDTTPQIRILLRNFDELRGRPQNSDFVIVWCSLKKLNTLGGSRLAGRDKIFIPDSACPNNLFMNIYPNTIVLNNASLGRYQYHIKKGESGLTAINIQQYNRDALHIFTFELNFYEFSSIIAYPRKKAKKIILKIGSESKIRIKANSLKNVKLAFKDGVQFHLHRKQILASLKTTDDIAVVSDFYANVISASTISMIIHNSFTNETITLARGHHHRKYAKSLNILHSDTDRKTHLIGSLHENVFSVSPYLEQRNCIRFHDVSISIGARSKNIIDLMNVRTEVLKIHSDLALKLLVGAKNTTIIEISYENKLEGCGSRIGAVTLHNPTFAGNIVVMSRVHMSIRYKNNIPYLEPLPLHFNKSNNIIIISEYDVEPNTEIIIDKTLGNDHKFYTSNNSLLITNIPSKSNPCGILEDPTTDLVAIFLIGYSQSESMQDLKLKFKDYEITMENEILDYGNDLSVFEERVDLTECLWESIMKLPVLVPAMF
uniref:Uncharacterized protein n=1 Tax=Romanomermis culicivorax TaxID=13658 RepID=A0A915L658_ROMCU